MDKHKIVMTRKLLDLDQEYITNGLRKRVGDTFTLIEPAAFDEDSIIASCKEADVLLGPYVTEKMLNKMSNIQLIQVPWTGMDTFPFTELKNHKNIPVCNSHSNAAVVAELGVAIIMDLLKKISYHDRKMRRNNWNRDQKPLDLKSRMLNQQTICILGYGHIGSRVGSILHAFDAKITAVNAAPISDTFVEAFTPDQTFEAVSQADVLVVTLPFTKSTEAMINTGFISHMKDGSMMILLSRAGVVDEDAVWDALQSGKLAGFAVMSGGEHRNEASPKLMCQIVTALKTLNRWFCHHIVLDFVKTHSHIWTM